MPFFQNPFNEDFEGNWLLADRQHIPKFVIKSNTGRASEHVNSWKNGPYDLSGNDLVGDPSAILKICFSLHNRKNWATLEIDLTTAAASSSAVTEQEVVASLNLHALFNERFSASVNNKNIIIRQKKPITDFKFYIINGQAEEKIGFNARAGIAELPTYFSRHTLDNRFLFEDSVAALIELDPSGNDVHAALIDNALDAHGVSLGYNSSIIQEDWQLLKGRSGLFQFTKGPSNNAVDSTSTTILYHAGAKVGDLAKKIVVQKDAGGLIVKEFEIPYTLISGDLITPP